MILSTEQKKYRGHNSDASVHFLEIGGRNPGHKGQKARSRPAAAHGNFTSSGAYTDNERPQGHPRPDAGFCTAVCLGVSL